MRVAVSLRVEPLRSVRELSGGTWGPGREACVFCVNAGALRRENEVPGRRQGGDRWRRGGAPGNEC